MNQEFKNMDDFAEFIRQHILDYLPKDKFQNALVRVDDIIRQNGEHYAGLSIAKTNYDVSPIIPLEDFYHLHKTGHFNDDILQTIAEQYLHYQTAAPDMSYLRNWENVKNRIFARFINVNSSDNEYLRQHPTQVLPNSEIGVIWNIEMNEFVNDENKHAKITVTHELLRSWNISMDTLAKYTFSTPKNCHALIQPLEHVLPPELRFQIFVPLIMVTNQQQLHGAIAITYDGVYETVKSMLGGDFYVLPSSIHEVICVEKSQMPVKDLLNMVRSINQTELLSQDFLADDVWEFQDGVLVSAISKMPIVQKY